MAPRFSEERPLLRPLPQRSFEARQVKPVAVSRQALVRVDGARYSVPSHWSGSQATAYVALADWRATIEKEKASGRRKADAHLVPAPSYRPAGDRFAPDVDTRRAPSRCRRPTHGPGLCHRARSR